ncbi:MAG: cyclic beta 1-2 glucan synthetase, partial [Gallionella sp.]
MFQHFRLPLYLGSILFLTTLLTYMFFSVGGFGTGDWRSWFFALAGILGISALTVPLVNLLVTLVFPPRMLSRLDFAKGIPSAYRTMVVVPTLLGSPQETDDLVEALEIRYLGNRDPNLFFALLTDFPDAPHQAMPNDNDLLVHARAAIQALNEKYRHEINEENRSCIFYLFHRPRVWNSHEQVWMGYERKRGKLEQFNARLRGEAQTAFSDIVGDVSILDSIKYVITLDTDTQLPRDTARTLIGNLAHPLNRPVYDAGKGRIVEGYAILQPRASISLTSASQSWFTQLFAGESGIDPYTREVSDVYQDIFGEGSFIGKGIYDVDAFRQALEGRFPENLILSHDLLESGYARSALVSDVDLIEEQPASYTMEASRRHRWIRGDWQIAGWLLPRVPGPAVATELKNATPVKRQPNPLSGLSLWKIFDNLRRSLVPPSLLVLLAGGWLLDPEWACVWTLLVMGVVFLPTLLSSVIELIRKPEERDWRVHLILTGKSAGRPIALALLTLVFLPYDTLICLDAILRSGVQMLFTRRGLLLWHMQSYARRNARRMLADFFMEMWIGPVLAVVLGWILTKALGGNRLEEWLFYMPILLLWLASPAIGWWISKPLLPAVPDLSLSQRAFLRTSARRTWRFFAEFVGPQDNHLPPDNFQEYPAPAIASRTSPTNIGMSLLANLAAYDFGYICAGEFLQLLESTVATMEKLERYRGHFYNWYDTRTLKPLRPQYVSSVDSGNLVGSLLTLQAGLAELKDQPVLSSTAFQGLHDTLQVLAEHLPAPPIPALVQKIKLLKDILSSLSNQQTLAAAESVLDEISHSGITAALPVEINIQGELYYWARAFDQQARALRDELKLLLPEPWQFNAIPTLAELDQDPSLGNNAEERLEIIDDLIARCRELAVMDFEFLYDTSRGLLTIGYDAGERRRDPSCYDLLASEARLASFLLIAQGQLPQKHWFSLGRLLTSHGGDVSLISWSGSM